MIVKQKILGGKIYMDGELWATFSNPDPACPLFNICNCKTAMCRVEPPDDSCYYYRYFKSIIEVKVKGNERKI